MATNARTTQNGTDTSSHRPRYIYLGRDDEGAEHLYRTVDETIHVISDGQRVHREDLLDAGKRVDDWMDYVEARREWVERHYGVPLVDQLAEAVEVDD